MADALDTVRTVSDLRARIAAWRGERHTIGLVPTMGGLHEGHLVLVRRSLALTERTVVTLFVNPTQFGEGEDFDTYPRDESADAALLAAEGVHLLFAPRVAEMYSDGAVTQISVPGISDAAKAYADDVHAGRFPGPEHCFGYPKAVSGDG